MGYTNLLNIVVAPGHTSGRVQFRHYGICCRGSFGFWLLVWRINSTRHTIYSMCRDYLFHVHYFNICFIHALFQHMLLYESRDQSGALIPRELICHAFFHYGTGGASGRFNANASTISGTRWFIYTHLFLNKTKNLRINGKIQLCGHDSKR